MEKLCLPRLFQQLTSALEEFSQNYRCCGVCQFCHQYCFQSEERSGPLLQRDLECFPCQHLSHQSLPLQLDDLRPQPLSAARPVHGGQNLPPTHVWSEGCFYHQLCRSRTTYPLWSPTERQFQSENLHHQNCPALNRHVVALSLSPEPVSAVSLKSPGC